MRPFVPFAKPRLIAPGLLQALGVVNNRIAGPSVAPPGLQNNPHAAPQAPQFQTPSTPYNPPGPPGFAPAQAPSAPPVELGGGSTYDGQQVTPPVQTTQDYVRAVGKTASGRVYGGRHVF